MRRVAFVAAPALVLFWFGLAASAAEGDAAKGKEVFGKLCVSCHGMTGKGDGAAAAALKPKPRDLSNKAYMSKLKNEYLSGLIAKGGASMGKSPLMPAFGGNLKEQDIKDVVAFIRSLAK